MLRGNRLTEVSARVVEEVRLPPKEHGYEPVIQMLEVIDKIGVHKHLYPKRTRTTAAIPST